jgi:Flp pilus assembly protein TadG
MKSRGVTRRGTTLVETAIVLSACFVFLFAIFEYGRFVMLRHLMDNAARESARQAIVGTNSLATTDIQNTFTSYLANQPITVTSFNLYKADPATGNNIGQWTDAGFGDAIAVDVQGTYNSLFSPITTPFGHAMQTIKFFPSNSIVLSTKVIMRSEAN